MKHSIMLCLSLISMGAKAQELTPSSLMSLQESGADSGVIFHGGLTTETIQYPTPVADRSEFSSNNLLRAQMSLSKKTPRALIATDLLATKSINLNYQFIAIGDLYAGHPEGKQGFYLGRKRQNWNQSEADWSLGLWQPLFQEDGLRQYQQGLTGLFYQGSFSQFEFTGLVSPMFIPSLNADLVEKDGTLVSESRWMRSLPEQATVNGRDVKLNYKLKTPPYAELLAKPTIAARLQWRSKESPDQWAALALARKPMNTLSIKYDAALVSRSVGFEGEAEVVPVVHMHNLLSLEGGLEFREVKLSASLIVDQPETKTIENGFSDDGFQTDYYQQQPKAAQIAILKAEKKTSWWDQDIQWVLSYLKIQNDKTSDFDSAGTQQSEFVPYRFLFTNAASVQAITSLTEKWKAKIKYIREFDQSGSVWSAEGQFQPNSRLAFFAGLDLLGIDQVSAVETDTRFLNSYRHNDRFFGGISYVF